MRDKLLLLTIQLNVIIVFPHLKPSIMDLKKKITVHQNFQKGHPPENKKYPSFLRVTSVTFVIDCTAPKIFKSRHL